MMDLFEKIYTHPRGDEKGQDGQGDQGPKGPYGSGYNPGFGHQGRYGQGQQGRQGQHGLGQQGYNGGFGHLLSKQGQHR